MASIVPSRSHLRLDSIGQPNLKLVASDRRNHFATVRTSEQLPKSAVTACLTARSSGNSALLRKASAAACENDGEFYAVLVGLLRTRLGDGRVPTLIDDAILASHLGARIICLESSDPVGELLRFARQSRVGRIFVARNRRGPCSQLFGRTVYSDLLSRSEGLRIDVVGFERGN